MSRYNPNYSGNTGITVLELRYIIESTRHNGTPRESDSFTTVLTHKDGGGSTYENPQFLIH